MSLQITVQTQNPNDGIDVSITVCCGEDGGFNDNATLIPLKTLFACNSLESTAPNSVNGETEAPTSLPTVKLDEVSDADVLCAQSMATTFAVVFASIILLFSRSPFV